MNFGVSETLCSQFMVQHVTARPCDLVTLTFEVMVLVGGDIFVFHPSTKFEIHRPCHSEDMVYVFVMH